MSVMLKWLFLMVGLMTMPCTSVAASTDKTPVRHIVVFKYKADATEAQIKQITDALGALQGKIPGILAFEYGVNNSPENLDQGFTHIYQFTFADAAARDVYLPHPQHKKFVELLGDSGILESVFVVDYAIQP